MWAKPRWSNAPNNFVIVIVIGIGIVIIDVVVVDFHVVIFDCKANSI